MSLPLLLTISSSYLRIGFRIYFTFAFFLIGFLGDKCLASRNQRSLAVRKSVSLTSMTGWLTDMTLLKAIIGFRRLPGGPWFGMFMIVCTALSLISDFAVTGLVRTVTVPSRCPFGTGLVIPNSSTTLDWSVVPNNGAPYLVAAQAQITSATNGGLVGIYWKVNRDLNFRADTVDVAGQWNCTDINHDIEYVANTTPLAIAEDLIQRGYIYDNNKGSYCRSSYGNGTFSHLIVWDTSVPGVDMGVSFDIRASIDLTPGGPDPKIMKSFHCALNGTGVEWILPMINTTGTLLLWCDNLQGNIYDGSGTGARNDSGLILEQYLNSMVMVIGGNGYLISTPGTTGDGGGNTQGCLVTRTSLPLEIIILFAIISIFVVVVIVDLVILSYGFKTTISAGSWKSAEGGYLNKIKYEMPNSLLGWMAQSVREGVRRDDSGEMVKEKDLKFWGFTRRDQGIGFGVGLMAHQTAPE